jgi:hypothetical protein
VPCFLSRGRQEVPAPGTMAAHHANSRLTSPRETLTHANWKETNGRSKGRRGEKRPFPSLLPYPHCG